MDALAREINTAGGKARAAVVDALDEAGRLPGAGRRADRRFDHVRERHYDTAEAVAFVASDEARMLTSDVINSTGGAVED